MAKPSETEIANAIVGEEIQEKRKIVLYALQGKHTHMYSVGEEDYPVVVFTDDGNAAICAKEITLNDDETTYWIKVDNKAKLYNPLGMYIEYSQHKQSGDSNRRGFRFKKTNYEQFHAYRKFLQTKNLIFLRTAERMI